MRGANSATLLPIRICRARRAGIRSERFSRNDTRNQMNKCYWVGNCSLCGQGRLVVMKDLVQSALYAQCEECEWGWRDPEQIGNRAAAFLTLLEYFTPRSPLALRSIVAGGTSRSQAASRSSPCSHQAASRSVLCSQMLSRAAVVRIRKSGQRERWQFADSLSLCERTRYRSLCTSQSWISGLAQCGPFSVFCREERMGLPGRRPVCFARADGDLRARESGAVVSRLVADRRSRQSSDRDPSAGTSTSVRIRDSAASRRFGRIGRFLS